MDPAQQEPAQQGDPVYTIDGEEISRPKAHKLAKRMFQFGCACLPLLWIMNVWLFWPDFRVATDPVLTKYTRRSLAGLAVISCIFFPWFLFYVSSGAKYLSHDAYHRLDVTNLPIRDYISV